MEQRIYHGNISPEGLAAYLVQQYNMRDRLLAQKLGQGDSLVVQIGQNHHHQGTDMRNAVTIGIHRAPENPNDLVVTMGEQQWITPEMAGYAAMMGLIAVLFTPWALFALIWPVSAMLGSRALPSDIWNQIQTYAMMQGAVPTASQTINHPHIEGTTGTFMPDGAPTQKLNDPRVG
ncbi:MAG: hypothetical protein ACR2M0_07310 [Chloroflexia bacterium]